MQKHTYTNELQKFLERFPDKPWDWWWLSRNPNISMKDVENNLDKPWDWQLLSKNKFKQHPVLREKAAKKIQSIWHDYWWKPNSDGIARVAKREWEKFETELNFK